MMNMNQSTTSLKNVPVTEDDAACLFCNQFVIEPRALNCGHYYCTLCLQDQAKMNANRLLCVRCLEVTVLDMNKGVLDLPKHIGLIALVEDLKKKGLDKPTLTALPEVLKLSSHSVDFRNACGNYNPDQVQDQFHQTNPDGTLNDQDLQFLNVSIRNLPPLSTPPKDPLQNAQMSLTQSHFDRFLNKNVPAKPSIESNLRIEHQSPIVQPKSSWSLNPLSWFGSSGSTLPSNYKFIRHKLRFADLAVYINYWLRALKAVPEGAVEQLTLKKVSVGFLPYWLFDQVTTKTSYKALTQQVPPRQIQGNFSNNYADLLVCGAVDPSERRFGSGLETSWKIEKNNWEVGTFPAPQMMHLAPAMTADSVWDQFMKDLLVEGESYHLTQLLKDPIQSPNVSVEVTQRQETLLYLPIYRVSYTIGTSQVYQVLMSGINGDIQGDAPVQSGLSNFFSFGWLW